MLWLPNRCGLVKSLLLEIFHSGELNFILSMQYGLQILKGNSKRGRWKIKANSSGSGNFSDALFSPQLSLTPREPPGLFLNWSEGKYITLYYGNKVIMYFNWISVNLTSRTIQDWPCPKSVIDVDGTCGASLLPAELLAMVIQMALVKYSGSQNKTSKQKVMRVLKGRGAWQGWEKGKRGWWQWWEHIIYMCELHTCVKLSKTRFN